MFSLTPREVSRHDTKRVGTMDGEQLNLYRSSATRWLFTQIIFSIHVRKDHMLKGRLIGMFLVNVLDEALFELGRLQSLLGHDEAVILSRLQQSEEHDSHSFRQQPPDVDVWRENTSKDMDSVTILRGESICHIALLPSRSRLEGITTQSKQQCELLEVDHKDFFLVREQDG